MTVTPQLRITGLVLSPREFTPQELAELPAEYQIPDVRSIDGSRAGRGVWLGGVLELVGVQPTAKYLGLNASTDDFHASIPLDPVRERGYIIYERDGQPLTKKSGGPFRFAIRDFAACHCDDIDECANVKFVDHIEFTAECGLDTRPKDDAEHAALHEEQT